MKQVAVRLRDIKSVRLVRDMSMKDTVTKNGPAKNIALAIDLNKGNEPLVITTLLNDVEVVMERLRFAVENAKTDDVSICNHGCYARASFTDTFISYSHCLYKHYMM